MRPALTLVMVSALTCGILGARSPEAPHKLPATGNRYQAEAMPHTNDCLDELSDAFCRPMNDLAGAQAIVRDIEALLRQRRLSLRPPPPVPDTCCGRGCNGCVWQGYYQALVYWRDQAKMLLR